MGHIWGEVFWRARALGEGNAVKLGSQGWFSVDESAEEERTITKERLYKAL